VLFFVAQDGSKASPEFANIVLLNLVLHLLPVALSLFLFPLLLVFRSEGSPLLLENGFYFSGDPRFVFGKTLHGGYVPGLKCDLDQIKLIEKKKNNKPFFFTIFKFSNLTEVHLGCHNQSDLSSSKMSRTLEDIICHPEFNNNTHENDICLLKLSVPVTFTDYIQPVCLASSKSFFLKLFYFFLQFGNDSFLNILREVNVPVVGNNECQCYYEGDKVIMENMICAGLSAGEKDSCQGNLGGQLMTKRGFEWLQSGVVTFNDDCARPAVFTRVSEYQNWIKDTVTDTLLCFHPTVSFLKEIVL
uniref:Peptidase S1 domain-containing protein n=1 Tax=Maylandia zebra TaxID=106582 RepID=A0A3P9CAG6_9CICH